MARAAARASTKPHAAAAAHARHSPPVSDPAARLTQAAFALSLGLVIVRMTMNVMFRNEAPVLPHTSDAPALPGPTTNLLLDLCGCLPALLVLARRWFDPTYTLKWSGSFVPMALLAAWSAASICWSADQFAAVVSASNWVCALVLLWSTAQLVRQALHLRLVAAAVVGLLLVLLVQGYYYRFVDLPDFQRQWREHHDEMLQQRGTRAGSVEATQLGKNIEHGEVTGFSLSRNTYAALLVLLMTITAGVVLQRLQDRDPRGWSVLPAIGIGAGLLMLYAYVESKTAFITPPLTALLLWLTWARRDWLARRARAAFALAILLLALATAAVVGHGLRHGTLVHSSLTFRWQYWVGASRVFAHHPWRGVGWGNFGPAYLAYRLPQAAEEPSDPHNFLVRAFVELGVLGGLLMLAWVLWLAWDVTASRSVPPPDDERHQPLLDQPQAGRRFSSAIAVVLGLSIASMTIGYLVAIDFSQGWAWLFLEGFKRALYLLALGAGMFAVACRSLDRPMLDARPAPWIMRAMLIGLGLFLLHNLIDFSLFEPGGTFLFALLAGAVLGMRLPDARGATQGRRAWPAMAFVLGTVALLVVAGAGLWPIARAEALAQDADAQIRGDRPQAAVKELVEAFRLVPINADYGYRAAQAAILARGNLLTMRALLDESIAADPLCVRCLETRADVEVAAGDPDAAWRDFDRALAIDPYNRTLRLSYARALAAAGRATEARQQYRRVLIDDDRLSPDEIKRLPADQVRQVEREIAALGR